MATVHREPNQVKWVGVRPGHNGEQVLKEFYAAATAEFYEVPADKLLLLFDWHLGVSGTAAGDSFIEIRDDGNVHYMYLALCSGKATDAGHNTSQALWVPIEIPALFDFRVITGVTSLAYIHGILIDA